MDKTTKCVRIFDNGFRLAVVNTSGRKWGYFVTLELPLVRRKVKKADLESMIACDLDQIHGKEYPMNKLKRRLRVLIEKHSLFFGKVPNTVKVMFKTVS
jgi:hypothetical protein